MQLHHLDLGITYYSPSWDTVFSRVLQESTKEHINSYISLICAQSRRLSGLYYDNHVNVAVENLDMV